jgi:hypothetical protein
MVAVLVGAVAAAAWLVHHRTTVPTRRAEAILRDLRSRGLRAYWPQDEYAASFTGRGPGREITGQIRRLRRREENGFVGRTDRRMPSPHFRGLWEANTELWRLSGDLSAGEYRSGRDPQRAPDIIIRLSDGQVEVVIGKDRASAAAPENYIPEGTMSLVARLVAAGGEPAAFSAIFNSQAIVAGEVKFSVVRMVPLSPRRVRMEYGLATGAETIVYDFDKEGRVAEFTLPATGETFTRVPPDAQPASQPEAGATARPGPG